MMRSVTWQVSEKAQLGALNALIRSIAAAEERRPGLLPNLRQTDTILVTSDYSGQEATATHESLSFLLCNPSGLGPWRFRQGILRKEHLADGRRFSFKALNDRKRRAALAPFLQAANLVPGLLATFLIPKGMPLFIGDRAVQRAMANERGWSLPIWERLLAVVTLLSVLIAGLSRQDQDVHWYSDDDAILPNADRIKDVAELFETVSSHILDHQLRHLRIGTAQSDVDRQLEDLLAISDVAAGALGHAAKQYQERGGFAPDVELPALLSKPKVATTLDWFADATQPLRRLTYLIESQGKGTRVTHLRFWGTNDLLKEQQRVPGIWRREP